LSGGVAAAVNAARSGKLIVIPTDTVYGIGTRPDLPEATASLFDAKRRPRELELPVLVPSADSATEIVRADCRASRLMEAFWPGPLTLVLVRGETSVGWVLGGDPHTIGVRMPDHPIALAVLERAGPLAVTSANVSGHATPATCEEVARVFGHQVDVYVCDHQPLAGRPSTVVDLTSEEPRILREGALQAKEVLGVASG
jgi:tRNA threonylcarbamoyl adenosine modification protein (Sua5/YciO/YrdC/YwlC family)